MRKDEPRMDQVELTLLLVLRDVSELEFDIVQPLCLRIRTREIELYPVDISRDHSPARTDHPRQVECQVPTSAANFKASHPGPDTCSSQQSESRGLHNA